MRLAGYAAVFGQAADIGGQFNEIVRKGAFRRTLRSEKEVHLLYHHRLDSPAIILATTHNGSLRLLEDETGLRFEAELAATTPGNDLGTLVKRGDLRHMSFAFSVPDPHGEIWRERSGTVERELIDIRLHEISIVASPAYTGTSVKALSDDPASVRARLLRRKLETDLAARVPAA